MVQPLSDPVESVDLRLGQLARDAALDARNLLVILQAYLERLDERFDEAAFRHELQGFIDEAGARVDDSLGRLEAELMGDPEPGSPS